MHLLFAILFSLWVWVLMNKILRKSSRFEHITLNPIHQWKNKKKTFVRKDIGFSLISTKDKMISTAKTQK